MKMRALGTAPPRIEPMGSKLPRTATAAPTLYAAVDARDAAGAPSHIALPGPLAGPRCGLYVAGIWAADVMPNGEVKIDRECTHRLAQVAPGTRIVAVTDPQGRVIVLSAVVRVSDTGKPKQQRAAASTRILSRSTADPYAPDPNELLVSGVAGKVLRVS